MFRRHENLRARNAPVKWSTSTRLKAAWFQRDTRLALETRGDLELAQPSAERATPGTTGVSLSKHRAALLWTPSPLTSPPTPRPGAKATARASPRATTNSGRAATKTQIAPYKKIGFPETASSPQPIS